MTTDVIFQFVDMEAQTILGAETSSKLSIMQRIHSAKSEIIANKEIPHDILHIYSKLFKGLGRLPGKHHIKIDHSVTPMVHSPRKVPVALKDKVKADLLRMQNLDVIVRQKQPTPWVNSTMTVIKPMVN